MSTPLESPVEEEYRASCEQSNSLTGTDTTPELDIMNADDKLRQEFNELVAANQELLSRAKFDSSPDLHLEKVDPEELILLRNENADLRNRLDEMEQLLQAALANEESWQERQKDYESLLDEKSETIRTLHMKLQQAQQTQRIKTEQPDTRADFETPSEVVELRRELEEQRRQLEEDEMSVMQQMREMELSMSRERAEMARQRNEIRRMHEDLQHEIEIASRSGHLRDQLANLRQQQQRLSGDAANPQPQPPPVDAPPAAKRGIFKTIFGK